MAKKANPKAKAAEKGSATHGTADESSLREQMNAALAARQDRLRTLVVLHGGERLRIRRSRHAMEGMQFDANCLAYKDPLLVAHVALRCLLSLLVDMIRNGRNKKPLPKEVPGAPGVFPQRAVVIQGTGNYRTTARNGRPCLLADPRDPYSLPLTLALDQARMYELRGVAKFQLRVELPLYLRTVTHFLNQSVIFEIGKYSEVQKLGPFTGSSWHAVALNISRSIATYMEEKQPRFLRFVERICSLDGYTTLPAHLESELSRVLEKQEKSFPVHPFCESEPSKQVALGTRDSELEPSKSEVASEQTHELPILNRSLEYFVDRNGQRHDLDRWQRSFLRVLLEYPGRIFRSREITQRLRKQPHFEGRVQADKIWIIGRKDRIPHPAIGVLIERDKADATNRDATWQLLPHRIEGDSPGANGADASAPREPRS